MRITCLASCLLMGAAASVILAVPASSQPGQPAPSDEFWDDRFCLDDVDGTVDAMVAFHGQLVVIGEFGRAGGASVRNIAQWDGVAWRALGSGIGGYSGAPVTVALLHAGSLVVASNRTDLGGLECCVARWDGASWSSMSTGAGGRIFDDLTVHDGAVVGVTRDAGPGDAGPGDAGSGAAGSVTVMRWDGDTWSPVGEPLPDVLPRETATFQSRGSGAPVAARIVDHAGELHVVWSSGSAARTQLARWTGAAWLRLAPLGGELQDAASFAGGIWAGFGDYTARWNGTVWTTISEDGVGTFLVHEGELWGWRAPEVVRWQGTAWAAAGAPFSDDSGPPEVRAMVSFVATLHVAGRFDRVGDEYARSVVQWTGAGWSAPLAPRCDGVDGDVYALEVHAGDLYVGGRLESVGGELSGHLAALTGDGWSQVNARFSPPPADGEVPVRAMVSFDDALAVAGDFESISNTRARGVALLRQGFWRGLGDGLPGRVQALEVYRERLYAAGEFGGGFDNIAVWDGAAWQPVGGGTDGAVADLAVFDGRLVAAGGFTRAGAVTAPSAAAWDGTRWMALGEAAAEAAPMSSVWPYQGRLVAARGGTGTASSLVVLEEGEWCRVDGFGGDATVVSGHDGRLTTGAATWDGVDWMPNGSGVSDVLAMTTWDGDLWLGGRFRTAGGKSARGLARWWFRDLTPPEVRLYVLQSPYVSELIDIYVLASETLLPLRSTVRVGDQNPLLARVDAQAHLWRADARLPVAEQVVITACGQDVSQHEACVSTTIGTRRFAPGLAGSLSTPDGMATLRVAVGVFARDVAIVAAGREVFAAGEGLLDARGLARDRRLQRDARSPARRARQLAGDAPAFASRGGFIPVLGRAYGFSPGVALDAGEVTIEFAVAAEPAVYGESLHGLGIIHHELGALPTRVDLARGTISASSPALGFFTVARVASSGGAASAPLRVSRPFPNPALGSTSIAFEVPPSDGASVAITDVGGRVVRRLLEGAQPGRNVVRWDGLRSDGRRAANGVYFFTVRSGGGVVHRKVTLIR